jgi:hypothetical protein
MDENTKRKEKQDKLTYPDGRAKRKKAEKKAGNALPLFENLAPSSRRWDGKLADWGDGPWLRVFVMRPVKKSLKTRANSCAV